MNDHSIRIATTGPPHVMSWGTIETPDPAPGQIRIRHLFVPVNNIDIQQRSGNYPVPLPSGLGVEAVGEVEAVGDEVGDIAIGDIVAYTTRAPGTYASVGICNSQQAVRISPNLPVDQVAAIFMRGLFAWHLTHTVCRVSADDRILVHAAAGGLGSLVAKLSASAGARVVGVVGSEAKVAVARAAGCAEVLLAGIDDLAGRVRETLGGGASIVYDSVGRDTCSTSLDSVRPHGTLVAYGNASGAIESISPWRDLGHRGSLRLVWPMVGDFLTPEMMRSAVPAVLSAIGSGELIMDIGGTFRMSDAANAHSFFEDRETAGATLLIAD